MCSFRKVANSAFSLHTTSTGRSSRPLAPVTQTTAGRGSRDKQGSVSIATLRRMPVGLKVRRPVDVPRSSVVRFHVEQTSTTILVPQRKRRPWPTRSIPRGANMRSRISASRTFARPQHWGVLAVFLVGSRKFKESGRGQRRSEAVSPFSAGTPERSPAIAPAAQGIPAATGRAHRTGASQGQGVKLVFDPATPVHSLQACPCDGLVRRGRTDADDDESRRGLRNSDRDAEDHT